MAEAGWPRRAHHQDGEAPALARLRRLPRLRSHVSSITMIANVLVLIANIMVSMVPCFCSHIAPWASNSVDICIHIYIYIYLFIYLYTDRLCVCTFESYYLSKLRLASC